MSHTIKDALIMAGAAGSVGLLVAGAEIGIPIIAGAGVVLAIGATIAKLSHSEEPKKANKGSGYRVAY